MRRYFALLIVLIITASCEKEDVLPESELCQDEYFYYYSGGSKIFFNHSLSEIWIVFEEKEVTSEIAESIVEGYSFLDFNIVTSGNYDKIRVRINEKCDCTDYRNFLAELNMNDKIRSATPIFYFSDNDPNSYFILLSEVVTKNIENQISEPDFINYAETLNLELIESTNDSTQHFKVKEIITGFEALEIANQIYDSGKVEYSHANGIASFGRL